MILVTGASGFVGRTLCARATTRGYLVRATVRTAAQCQLLANDGYELVSLGDVTARTDWSGSLKGNSSSGKSAPDCVIHCLARAHVMQEQATEPLAAYRAINVDVTRRFAQAAAAAGVRRFIFLSSIGVNGISTDSRGPFSPSDPAAPVEAYAVSKWEAEQALWEVAAKTGLEAVVIRPPLVYGPQVKGNFLRLLRLVAAGVPLPLGSVSNRRSLLGLDNLVDLLIHCIDHPAAAGETFLVSDGEDLSTPDLLHQLAQSMGKRARLFRIPVSTLRAAGWLTGNATAVNRLLGSLQVDSSHTRAVLHWSPTTTVEAGLKKTAKAFMANSATRSY